MRARRWLLDRGGLLALLALGCYVAVVAPTVVDGDNAELAALGTVGGVAHPTGYPAYLLWLRVWSWLPAATPAQATGIATAILGALGVLTVHAACRAWGARPLAAAAAAAIYAVGPEVVRYASEAEVFALNQLVVAAILWLAAERGPLRGGWRVAVLALVAGLGLADHVTCVLAAPVGLLGVVRGLRETARPRAAVVAAGVGALALGLAPYAYLCVTSTNRLSWGDIDSLDALVRHFLREDYGGPGSFAPKDSVHDVAGNLLAWSDTLARGWLYAPCAAGLAWLALRCARPRADTESVWGWRVLAVTFALAGPLLVSRFNIALGDDLARYVIGRFHMMSMVLLAPAVAAAFEAALARVATGERARARERAGWIAVHLGMLAAFATTLPHLSAIRTPAYEDGVSNVLTSLPPDAVVIQSRELYFPGNYLQLARGVRPDVTIVDWPLVPLPWYRARLAAHGIDVVEGGDASLQVVRALLAQHRQVFVDQLDGPVLAALPTYPYGTVFRVLPEGTPRPSIAEVYELNKQLFAKFALDYPFPGEHDEYATIPHVAYARAWRIIADGLAAAGDRQDAAAASAILDRISPQRD